MPDQKEKGKSQSWGECPFTPGRFYRIKKDFRSFGDHFQQDDVLQFVRESYSIYDGVPFYAFDGGTWEVRYDEQLEAWSDYFSRDE